MNLRRLQHFVTLVEQGSFVRAAKLLHVTQSGLSHSIRMLEEELGLVLLDRSKSGTKPTHVGAQLLRDARNVLRDKKMEEVYAAWAQEVRNRAYVELREPPQS